MSVQNSNGVKTIEAEENDRKVKITEDAAGGIKMDVTTTKNGKEVTDKYEAKNADDLKKKNGPAYDLYKQYSSGQRGGAIAFGGAMGPGFMPNVPGQPNIRVQPLGGPMPVQAFGANRFGLRRRGDHDAQAHENAAFQSDGQEEPGVGFPGVARCA